MAEDAGLCESTLQFDLRINPRANWSGNDAPVVLTANERAHYLEATENIQVSDERVAATLAFWREPGQDQAALAQARLTIAGRRS